MTRTYLINGLSILDSRLGNPAWFWPAVMFTLFIALPCIALIVKRTRSRAAMWYASSLAVALLIAIPFGVLAAVKPGSWLDRLALSLAVLGQAMPSYWTGLLLILLFGVQLQVLPISGTDSWESFVLPTFALGWFVMPVLFAAGAALVYFFVLPA